MMDWGTFSFFLSFFFLCFFFSLEALAVDVFTQFSRNIQVSFVSQQYVL